MAFPRSASRVADAARWGAQLQGHTRRGRAAARTYAPRARPLQGHTRRGREIWQLWAAVLNGLDADGCEGRRSQFPLSGTQQQPLVLDQRREYVEPPGIPLLRCDADGVPITLHTCQRCVSNERPPRPEFRQGDDRVEASASLCRPLVLSRMGDAQRRAIELPHQCRTDCLWVDAIDALDRP